MTIYHDVIETRFGWMGLLRSETGLMRTTLPQSSPERCIELLGEQAADSEHAPDRFAALGEKLRRYFEGGKLNLGDEPLDLEGATPFHREAWRACMSNLDTFSLTLAACCWICRLAATISTTPRFTLRSISNCFS